MTTVDQIPPLPVSRSCAVPTCDRPIHAKGWCMTHYRRVQAGALRPDVPIAQAAPTIVGPIVACPDELLPLVNRCVENDARPIFLELWRLIGLWHLQDTT